MRVSDEDKRLVFIVSAVIGLTVGLTALINSQLMKTSLPFTMDQFIFLALIVAIFPPAVVNLIDSSWKASVDNAIPKFLREISEAGRTGVTLVRAIELASKRKYGPLSVELKKIVTQISWGLSLDEAFKRFAERVATRQARITAVLLSEIHRAGGDIQEVLETVSSHIGELQNIERERRSMLRPYITIVYIAFFIFLFIDIILIKTFFEEIEASKTVMIEAGGSLFTSSMDLSKIKEVMFHISILEGLFGGIVAGKMGEGSVGAGLKHSLVMMVLGFVIFYVMIWRVP